MKKLFTALMFVAVAGCGQRNSVIDLRGSTGVSYFNIDISDSVRPLIRITATDTIINDTLGSIRYLIKENQRLYDANEKLNEKLLKADKMMGRIDGLLLYLPKREQHFKL
jgi:hypothetical protein